MYHAYGVVGSVKCREVNVFILTLDKALEAAQTLAIMTKQTGLAEKLGTAKSGMRSLGMKLDNFEIAPQLKKDIQAEIDKIAIEQQDRINASENKANKRMKEREKAEEEAAKRAKAKAEGKVESMFDMMTRNARIGLDKAKQWGVKNKKFIDEAFKEPKAAKEAKNKERDFELKRAGLVTRGSVAEFDALSEANKQRARQTGLLAAIAKNTAKNNAMANFAIVK